MDWLKKLKVTKALLYGDSGSFLELFFHYLAINFG